MCTDQTNKIFIEGIRAEYMGIKDSPRRSLTNSIQTLADDLYAKDTHFIFELIQNAEDNDYASNVQPTLRFCLLEMEYQGQAQACLLVENNEIGFKEDHVKAICQVGESTKKKIDGYIGEKGIGFKSVFRVTDCPQVHSNGFHFSLPKKEEESGLGYIVPVWIDTPPANLRDSETTIVLPLKDDEDVYRVASSLQDIAAETILFLTRLRVIEIKVDLPHISYEIVIEKHASGTSVVDLTYLRREWEEESIKSSRYWLASSQFKKPPNITPEKRKDIESREVFVAIPLGGDQSHAGKLFAYLPVWESTGVPFLINADFLLVSSREGIHENDPWNKWLRECIAQVYVDALLTCVAEDALLTKERANAYASIPMDSHQSFLKPVVTEVQRKLRETECIITSSNAKLVKPEHSRLIGDTWRTLFDEPDSNPSALGSEFFFVHRAIPSNFESALTAIGVLPFSPDDVAACLKDTARLSCHSYDWLINLYRSMEGFESEVLDGLRIVPAVLFLGRQTEYQCGSEHPIYFRPTWEECKALREIPAWLRKARPVSFLPKAFQQLLDAQEDSEDLRKWMTDLVAVYDFTAANYCVDLLTYLEDKKNTISKKKLVEITRFLCEHAGRQFDWECLPVFLSDDTRMTVGEARKGTANGNFNNYAESNRVLVVPENCDPYSGWQYIWQEESDREHFVALHSFYSKCSKDLFEKIGAVSYPGMASVIRNEERFCSDPLEKTALLQCKERAARSRSEDTKLNSFLLPKFPSPMTKECARSLLGWLRSLNIRESVQNDQLWECGLKIKGNYYKYRRYKCFFDSPLLVCLRCTEWLPTSKGLVRPSLAFLPTPEAKEVLGETVPYFEGNLPRNLLNLLEINTSITVDSLMKRLEACSTDADMNLKLPERIYRQLSSRLSYSDGHTAIQRFRDKPLIFIPYESDNPRWVKTSECVWGDASGVFGNDFSYLEGAYPKLKEFFIQTLGVKAEVDAENYALHWLKLQRDADQQDKEFRPTVDKIYREIRKVLGVNPQKKWLTDFCKDAKVYTQNDRFEDVDAVVIPDDGDLKRLFEGEVAYAWRPSGDSFAAWSDFYTAFGLERLSECVTVKLAADILTEPCTEGRFLTKEAVQMIASWLREKESELYSGLVLDRVFQRLFEVKEERSKESIRVSYTISIGGEEIKKEEAAIVLWDDQNSRLVLGPSADAPGLKQAAAKQLARYILRGKRDEHGLENWIELVLGARDTRRVKTNSWSVPREILQLCPGETTGPELPGINEDDPTSQALEAEETECKPTDVVTSQSPSDDTGVMPQGKDLTIAPQVESKTPIPSSPQKTEQTQSKTYSQAMMPGSVGEGRTDEASWTYADMLNASLNQPGKTEIGEDWRMKDIPDGGSAHNLNRRSARLAEGYKERIENEPEANDRRRATERTILEPPDPHVEQTLLEWYGGRCQICDITWPERNGRPFFVTARLVERYHARWLDDPANAVCLCAEHFAQWRYASKETCEDIPDQVASMVIPSPIDKASYSIRFKLLGEDVRVKYCEKHLLALKTLLNVSEEPT